MPKKVVSDLERFSAKYEVDSASGCWNWIKRLDPDGYAARVKVGSRSDGTRRDVRPPRWFYEHEHGPIEDGFVIDHLCRNRKCVNPAHLETVTPAENTRRGLRAMARVCPRGHEIEGTNEVTRPGGHRCRVCLNAYMAAYHRRTDHVHSKAYRSRQREMQNR